MAHGVGDRKPDLVGPVPVFVPRSNLDKADRLCVRGHHDVEWCGSHARNHLRAHGGVCSLRAPNAWLLLVSSADGRIYLSAVSAAGFGSRGFLIQILVALDAGPLGNNCAEGRVSVAAVRAIARIE